MNFQLFAELLSQRYNQRVASCDGYFNNTNSSILETENVKVEPLIPSSHTHLMVREDH